MPPLVARIKQCFVYLTADRLELLHDFQIGESNYTDPLEREHFRPAFVVPLAGMREMGIAVQFNNEAGLRTVEVRYVMPERLLSSELLGMRGQKIEPQPPLGGARVTTQVTRSGFQIAALAEEGPHGCH